MPDFIRVSYSVASGYKISPERELYFTFALCSSRSCAMEGLAAISYVLCFDCNFCNFCNLVLKTLILYRFLRLHFVLKFCNQL